MTVPLAEVHSTQKEVRLRVESVSVSAMFGVGQAWDLVHSVSRL